MELKSFIRTLKMQRGRYAKNPNAEAKKGMDDSQVTGSVSSYARKYALNGLFAIDDNNLYTICNI